MKYIPSGQTIKARCTSVKAWELPKQESALAPPDVWTNRDMDVVPMSDRTWSVWTYCGYWATDTINLGTWETASSVIAVGLNWRDAIPVMVVGTFCVAIPMILNGAIGAKLHIPFSVIVRSSFGYYLAYFCIISRSILAMFWLGIQGANGALTITIMLSAIWPSYYNIPNSLSESPGNDRRACPFIGEITERHDCMPHLVIEIRVFCHHILNIFHVEQEITALYWCWFCKDRRWGQSRAVVGRKEKCGICGVAVGGRVSLRRSVACCEGG